MSIVIRGVSVPDKDLNQRFANNYIEVLIEGRKGPEVVRPEMFDMGFMYLRGNRELGAPIPHKAVKIVREFPDLGVIHHVNAVHVLTRLPHRQWTRGFNAGVIRDFCRVPGASFNNLLDHPRAKSVFYPQYFDIQEGFPKLKKEEWYSFAYDKKFWFSGNKRTIYLWYEEIPVGEVQSGVLFFNRECSLLKQEVKDEFKNAFEIK